jgi:hypothetical protein
MTRLSMIVDTINQDFILPNVEKVAKLCADFKSGVETIFINNKNQPETIEIDDSVRQADYKYTYSDSSNTTLKSEQADILVQAVEKFAQRINLNLEEIFVWYFEQKGIDNPERFLAGISEGLNSQAGLDASVLQSTPQGQNGLENNQVMLPDFMNTGDEDVSKKLTLLRQMLSGKSDENTLVKIIKDLKNN